jgi:hypothetical protein
MPAERRRAATLDRRHHLQLAEADMAGVSLTPRRSVAAASGLFPPRRLASNRLRRGRTFLWALDDAKIGRDLLVDPPQTWAGWKRGNSAARRGFLCCGRGRLDVPSARERPAGTFATALASSGTV